MVGGGNRKDDSLVLNSTNVFAALGTLRKKKKSDKEQGSSKGGRGSDKKQGEKEPEPQVFWNPAPLTVKSWADVEDEDDDDYYATTAPIQAVWATEADTSKQEDIPALAEETESEEEEDDLDEVDDENEEDHEHKPDNENEKSVAVKVAEIPQPLKDPERQLSKKELKKKELAELEAVLAEFAFTNSEASVKDESLGAAGTQEKKIENTNGVELEKSAAAVESKTGKKKKKKDKVAKEVVIKETEKTETEETEKVEDSIAIDMKEKLKKVASVKKKKSGKEMDGASRAAASEAAARTARLAAAKKKEKTHYNQQPVR